MVRALASIQHSVSQSGSLKTKTSALVVIFCLCGKPLCIETSPWRKKTLRPPDCVLWKRETAKRSLQISIKFWPRSSLYFWQIPFKVPTWITLWQGAWERTWNHEHDRNLSLVLISDERWLSDWFSRVSTSLKLDAVQSLRMSDAGTLKTLLKART